MITSGHSNTIVLLGGSFDPVHNGHIALANAAAAATGAEKILLLPARVSPLKEHARLLPESFRQELLRLALPEIPKGEICNLELSMPVPSYTVNTVERLAAENPDAHFWLAIGADQLLHFEEWHEWRRLLSLAGIAAAARGTAQQSGLLPAADRLRAAGGQVTLLAMPPIDCSSTEIRRRLLAGESVAGMVPESVEQALTRFAIH